MSTELHHVLAGDTLRYKMSELPSGQYKILIPRGTVNWTGVAVAWKSDEDSEAFMALDASPDRLRAVSLGEDGDSRKVLEDLWAGKTIRVYSIPYAQGLSMSQPEQGGVWRADRDRWLFIDVRFAAGRAQQYDSQIVLDQAYAPVPVPAPPPVNNDEARTLALVQQAGLVPALNTFGACTSDADLIDRAVSSGVWAGLIELVRLAQTKGAA